MPHVPPAHDALSRRMRTEPYPLFMANILVTGSSAGLGLNAAHALVALGHRVIVHARDESRVPKEARDKPWLGVLTGDLSDPEQTRSVAAQANRFGRLDAVIHNAGALHAPAALPVNVFAPFVLTALMNKPARLIYLTSSMHRGASIDLNRLTSGNASYSDTKLWVTALALAFAARWPETSSHAVDPGWVPTRMGGPSAPDDLAAGHRTQVWLATAEAVTPATGGYWHHEREQRPDPRAPDTSFQTDLIRALQDATGIRLDASGAVNGR